MGAYSLTLGTSHQIPTEVRMTQSDIDFTSYRGGQDAVLVWMNMQGMGAATAMLIEDFDKYLYKTQGAFDSFEGTSLRNEGWVQLEAPFSYEISKERAAAGSQSMKLAQGMVSRNIPSMKNGTIAYNLFLPEEFSTTLYTEFKAAYNTTLKKNTPIYFYINASGELCSKAVGTPTTIHATLVKGEWHTIEVVFDLTAQSSTLYVDGSACGTLPVNFDEQVATIALVLEDESPVYIDDFRAGRGNKYMPLVGLSGESNPGGGTVTPPVDESANGVADAVATVTANVSDGVASASVTVAQMSEALKQARETAEKTGGTPTVEIKVENTSRVSTATISMPGTAMQKLASGGSRLIVISGFGSVTFDAAVIKNLSGTGDVTLTVAQETGERPVYEITVVSGGKTVSQVNGTVTVSVPYTLRPGEDPNAVVVNCINASGNLEMVMNGCYDAAMETVVFSTSLFSRYVIDYNKIKFTDVAGTEWYSDAVTFLAARGITSGTSETTFSPDGKLTRGQFITLLMRAYGIAPDKNSADNFSDAGDTYYTGYLAAAKRLSVTAGVGGNKFAPEQVITRQEMFTLLYNVLRMFDKLPEGNTGKTLSNFSDSDTVASWAIEAMTMLVESGIVSGNGAKLDPAAITTRAQMAQVIYNLLK